MKLTVVSYIEQDSIEATYWEASNEAYQTLTKVDLNPWLLNTDTY